MSKFWKLLIIPSLLILTISLFSQDRTCIDFEHHIEPGTYGVANGYTPGRTLFTDQDVIVKLQNFYYADSTFDFINATITDDEIFNGDESELLQDQYIFPSNINLHFNFVPVRGQVVQVCINFIDGGGVENLSVNGSPIRVLQSFVGLSQQEIAPGVTARLALSDDFDFPAGTLCLTGPIDSLVIGGQELALDNVCFRTEDDNPSEDTCGIANFRAEVLGCNPNGTFNLRLNFDHSFHSSDSFFVIFRGDTLGRYAISQLPLTLENLRGEEEPHIEDIKVCFPIPGTVRECCAETEFRLPDCQSNGDSCNIRNFTAEVLGCNPNGTFRLKLNFSSQSNQIDSFFVIFRGQTLGRFGMNQLPLTLDNLRGDDEPHVEDIKVCFQNRDCCAETEFRLPDCQNENDTCRLGTIRYSNLECIAENKYRVTINFEREHTSGVFVLRTRGGFVGEFQYGQLPLRIALPRTADSLDVWTIQDARDTSCHTSIRLSLPCGFDDPNSCALRNARYEGLECISENRYRVTIKFEHNRPEGKFVLQSRSGLRDTFDYAQLPLRLAIPRPVDSLDVLYICDLRNPNCCIRLELILPCSAPNPCALGTVRYEDLECISENRYRVTIKFEHNRPDGNFVLQSLSGYRDTFSYAQLPLRLPIPRPNDSLDILSICDLRSPNCCTRLVLDLPCRDTSNNQCNIANLSAQPTRCADGKFMLNVSFHAQNTGALGYLIFVDGQIFGPFRYNQTSQVLGPFTADGVTIYDVLVLDVDDPTCYAYTEVRPVRCDDTPACNITNLRVAPLDCDSNGTFGLTINFNHQRPAIDSFFVRYRGERIGRFATSQLPLTIRGLRSDDEPHEESISVCFLISNTGDLCCNEVRFLTPDCNRITEDTCRIYDLAIRALPCDSIGRFYVKLHFESEHTESDSFTVRGNGRLYGTFRYTRDSILIGPLQGNGSTVYEFIIQDKAKPGCRDFIEIGPIACEEPVWPGDGNVNNRADHIDLLNIGLAYGAQGPARSTQSLSWQEYRSISWNKTFADGTNYAHADCNGDGIVNVRDREAIARNYGLTHGPIEPVTPLPGTNLDPPIFVDLPDTSGLPAGLAFTAPVILGSANNFVENIYGIAFTIEFNPRVIDPESVQVTYPKSWFGTENTDFITFHQIDTASGLIHIAMTRINQRNVSGFGAIALISGVIDDIAGIVGDSEVKVRSIQAIDFHQQLIPLHAPVQMLKLVAEPAIAVGKLDLQRSLQLLPNPTNDWVQIYTKYLVPVKSIEILDANGKWVGQAEQNTNRVSLADLPQGVYILRIQIGEYVLNERIVKM